MRARSKRNRAAAEARELERFAADFMAADLPWLRPFALELFDTMPEAHGRADGRVTAPSSDSEADLKLRRGKEAAA